MSAESPSRRSTSRCVPTVIPPQAVSDRSIIDSVTGFINEVALHSGGPPADAKEQIIWSRFETDADISDLSFGEDWDLEEGSAPPPLILTLGYGTGIQMWAIPANGDAIEVLSWRHGGPVKCLKILPTPLMEYGDDQGPATDLYHAKRPLIAIADTAGSIVNFVSLRDGDTVKSIKFKHPVVDILANRTTVVITFQERIAVFDARTFEDRCTVTTCFPSPGLSPNPVALGSRWLAYAELKMMPSKRSNGGCDGLVNTSTMASVISAAKTLGKGLKGIGETIGLSSSSGSGSSAAGGAMASGHHGGAVGGVNVHYSNPGGVGGATGHSGLARQGSSGGLSPSGSQQGLNSGDGRQPGMITVMDIKYAIKDFSPTTGTPVSVKGTDPMVAHFIAHSDAIVNIAFDPSGMLLLTADKKGHDFNLFRIYPHPGGPSLAAVHHLYVLHRGDTTAKVQDICFSMDSRWVAVSSLRGTTHVFPITPYGGNVCIRTHGSSQVVNQLSRFHRSAGLSMDGRCSSPVTHSGDGGSFGSSASGSLGGHLGGGGLGGVGGGAGGGGTGAGGANGHYQNLSNAYANPRIPPFAHPTIVLPLTQLRQPYAINTGTQAAPSPHVKDYLFNVTLGRQRHSSLSDDSMMGGAGGAQASSLRVCATFARPRAWLLDPPGGGLRDAPAMRMNKMVMDSLFVMASHGALIQYDLEPRHAASVVREKVCDDTPIELFVEAKAQWNLLRNEARFNEIQPPLPWDNLLLIDRLRTPKMMYGGEERGGDSAAAVAADDDRWLSRVEIITHAGPHRRLWMGPQFIFKTYNTPSGMNLHHIEVESVEIGLTTGGAATAALNGGRPAARSNPMNMPGGERPIVPVFIESGSYSSYEQSPRFRSFEDMDDFHLEPRDSQLREDLADAMRDCSTGGGATGNVHNSGSSASSSSAMSSCMMMMMVNNNNAAASGPMFESLERRSAAAGMLQRPESALSATSIENIVNPLGTVTTVVRPCDQMADSFQSSNEIAFPDQYIHENCDEALFRPVVQVIEQRLGGMEEMAEPPQQAPVRMSTELIVPVIIPKATVAKIEKKEEKEMVKVVEPEKEEKDMQGGIPVIECSKKVEKAPEPMVPVAPVVEQPKQNTKQSKQKNKRNKEKTPPMAVSTQNIMDTSTAVVVDDKATVNVVATVAITKGNGSKGRKSSGQEPKAGKIRKSERNNEEEEVESLPPPIISAVVKDETCVIVKAPSPPPKVEEEVKEEPVVVEVDLGELAEVEAMPSKEEMEIIQDSLMKEIVLETVTLTSSSNGGGGGKRKKKGQKNAAKVETPPEIIALDEEQELRLELEIGGKQEMIVDISETKYDLGECIEQRDSEFENMYTDPLVPLEPFDPQVTFETVECPNELEEEFIDESLMTFESPILDKLMAAEDDLMKQPEESDREKLHKMFADRNLVFAMCTSLRDGSEEGHVDKEDVNISSAPGWQLEIHEDYMDMDQNEKKLMMDSMTKMSGGGGGGGSKLSPVLTASTGSSEEEVSSSSTGDGKSSGHTTTTATEDDEEGGVATAGRRKASSSSVKVVDDEDDEELQPLIKEEQEENRREGEEDTLKPAPETMAAPSSKGSSKESTPTPQQQGNKGGQSSKKKSRKKKR